MNVEVGDNPNCRASDQFVFRELEAPRGILGIRVTERGKESRCDVIGVEPSGQFVRAHAVKITDSGAGFAYLIYGGEWGIRLRPEIDAQEPWDLSNPRQWGEPFKIYGEERDIIF